MQLLPNSNIIDIYTKTNLVISVSVERPYLMPREYDDRNPESLLITCSCDNSSVTPIRGKLAIVQSETGIRS